jgi:hypothetical protein
VQVLGRTIRPHNVQKFAQSDDLDDLIGQNYLGILQLEHPHADHVISEGLETRVTRSWHDNLPDPQLGIDEQSYWKFYVMS